MWYPSGTRSCFSTLVCPSARLLRELCPSSGGKQEAPCDIIKLYQ